MDADLSTRLDAADRRIRCHDWLAAMMAGPKPAGKAALYAQAHQSFGATRGEFEFAWAMAIETTGRFDWRLPRRVRRDAELA